MFTKKKKKKKANRKENWKKKKGEKGIKEVEIERIMT